MFLVTFYCYETDTETELVLFDSFVELLERLVYRLLLMNGAHRHLQLFPRVFFKRLWQLWSLCCRQSTRKCHLRARAQHQQHKQAQSDLSTCRKRVVGSEARLPIRAACAYEDRARARGCRRAGSGRRPFLSEMVSFFAGGLFESRLMRCDGAPP